MPVGVHGQPSFIIGIKQPSVEQNDSYFNSAFDIKNFIVNTGGSLIRRGGTEIVNTINLSTPIDRILPIGDGFIYISGRRLFVKYQDVTIELQLTRHKKKFYSLTSGEETRDELLQLPPIGILALGVNVWNSEVVTIAQKEDRILVLGSNQDRYYVDVDEDVLTLSPTYFEADDPVTGFIRSHFYPVEYNKIPNPFRDAEGNVLSEFNNRCRLVIDAYAYLTQGGCRAWIEIDPSVTLPAGTKVDVSVMNLSAYNTKPIAFNILPTQIPIVSTAGNYSSNTSSYPVLTNLFGLSSLTPSRSSLQNDRLVPLLNNLLFQRRYVILPFRTGGTVSGLQDVSAVYNNATVQPAKTILNVTGRALTNQTFETPDTSTPTIGASASASLRNFKSVINSSSLSYDDIHAYYYNTQYERGWYVESLGRYYFAGSSFSTKALTGSQEYRKRYNLRTSSYFFGQVQHILNIINNSGPFPLYDQMQRIYRVSGESTPSYNFPTNITNFRSVFSGEERLTSRAGLVIVSGSGRASSYSAISNTSSQIWQTDDIVIRKSVDTILGESSTTRSSRTNFRNIFTGRLSQSQKIASLKTTVDSSLLGRTNSFNYATGFNQSDNISIDTQDTTTTRPTPLLIAGSIDDGAGHIEAIGLRLKNNTQTTNKEVTPFIIFKTASEYSRQSVSGTAGYELQVRNKGDTNWTSYVLGSSAVVPLVGVEYSEITPRNYTNYDDIDWDSNFEFRIRPVADRSSPSGDFIVWRPAINSTKKSSNAFMECVILEIGTQSPYQSNDVRTIGGNDYNGNINYASNVLFSSREEVLDVTPVSKGVGVATKDKILTDFGEGGNNIQAYLTSSISPDAKRVLAGTSVKLDENRPSSLRDLDDVLARLINTRFPNNYLSHQTRPIVEDFFNGTYITQRVIHEFEVFNTKEPNNIERVYNTFDNNTLVMKTRNGIYELDFASTNTSLRSREAVAGDLELFLRKMVFATKEGKIGVATISFERYGGYLTKIYGNSQTELLKGLTDIKYSTEQRLYTGVKQNGSIVSFTDINDQIVGFTRFDIPNFFTNQVFLKDGEFHFLGRLGDDPNYSILKLDSVLNDNQNYIDYGSEAIESEVITNNLAYGEGIAGLGHLSRGNITEVRVFSNGLQDFSYGFSSESQPRVLSSARTMTGSIIKIDSQKSFTNPPLDYLTRFHLYTNSPSSGGIIYGLQIKGNID